VSSREELVPVLPGNQRLRDIVTVVKKSVLPENTPDGLFLYVAMENVEQQTGRITPIQPVMGRKIASAKFQFQKGDILYGRLRPYLQKVAIAPFDGICSTEFIPLRPKFGVSAEFVREFLLSSAHLSHVEALVSGARMPRLRPSDLLNAPVPSFSHESQAAIGRACTVFRLRTYAIEQQLRQVIALSDRHRIAVLKASEGEVELATQIGTRADSEASILLTRVLEFRRSDWEAKQLAAFESAGRLPNGDAWKDKYREPTTPSLDGLPQLPTGWTWASVEQLTLATSPICYGVVQPGDEPTDGVPMVRVNDLQDDTIRFGNLRRISFDVDASHARSRLVGGEVLVTVVGSIGRVAIAPSEMAGMNIARAIAKLTVTPLAPAKWIANALSGPRLQFWMQSSSREVARKTLNLEALAKAAIALPPASVIEEILLSQDKHLEAAKRICSAIGESLARLEHFRKSGVSKILRSTISEIASSEDSTNAIEAFFQPPSAPLVDNDRQEKELSKAKQFGETSQTLADQSLFAIVSQVPTGLTPYDLLIKSGKSVDSIEEFYQELVKEINKGRIVEMRIGPRDIKLFASHHAN
jgi:type I restriction enzyme S subunit